MKSIGRHFFGRVGSVCALCAFLGLPAYGQEAVEGADERVEVSDFGTVTLAVQDTDLAQVLEMLSIQSQKNIITSKNVSATISANLFDVTFYEALDAILKVNGYDYREEGNFIYIYTIEELSEIEKAMRTTESRTYVLDYLSAADAAEFITPLLSEDGQSSYRGDVDPGFQPDLGDGGADMYAFEAKLVVNDYPENLDAIGDLLDDLDTPPQQVLLEATILQTALDEANAFGVDFSLVASVDFTDLANPLSGVNNLLSGSDTDAGGFQPADNRADVISSTPGNTSAPGTFKMGVVHDDLAVFLRVLDEVTDTTVLSRPKIMCLNRQRAEILVGAKVGYLSTTATETSTTQTVEFLDTGITLTFRPFISRNGAIRLELKPKVSEALLREVTNAQNARVTIPDELTNELTTNVRVQDGETLVLGGLFKESNTISRRQVPVLGDIPLLGAAFRGQDDEVNRDEIIFLITPSIVHDELLWAMGEKAGEYGDDLLLGSRRGLLPFSRERQTMNHNKRAIEAYNRGDLEAALYHTNNSLRLKEVQPEMVRFRERLTGAEEMTWQRSLMDRMLDRELRDVNEIPDVDENLEAKASTFDTTYLFYPVYPTVHKPAKAETTKAEDPVDSASEAAANAAFNETTANDAQAAGQVDPWAEQTATQMKTANNANHDMFVDQFIVDYFAALGISHLSPFPERTASGPEFNMFPFADVEAEEFPTATATAEEDRPVD